MFCAYGGAPRARAARAGDFAGSVFITYALRAACRRPRWFETIWAPTTTAAALSSRLRQRSGAFLSPQFYFYEQHLLTPLRSSGASRASRIYSGFATTFYRRSMPFACFLRNEHFNYPYPLPVAAPAFFVCVLL